MTSRPRPGGVAVVGMACRYPGADDPLQLWENVLAGRQAFRRMPAERLRFEDHVGPDTDGDEGHPTEVAVLRDYRFDRARFRVPATSYATADVTHWLALHVATEAVAAAGFGPATGTGAGTATGLPRDTTGVMVGNTLTGEMARAATLRLRWPYVRRLVDRALAAEGWDRARRQSFLADLRQAYKAPFPPQSEESLAGGMANTIAGRICSHLGVRGGGYVVDGACSSSLLAVATACAALEDGRLDVAVVGAVDVSLDPFELVGFAQTGALARDEMRVYDERPTGFLPGEGCGFVTLMRSDDAAAEGRPSRAVIEGWGMSSDGRGGVVRPDVDGQLLALTRAYTRAGRDPRDIGYVEGHGTGTEIGDATELRALRRLIGDTTEPRHPGEPGEDRDDIRGDDTTGPRHPGELGEHGRGDTTRQTERPVVLGSVKATIGHTKAAAGMAGLLTAVMALEAGVRPPLSPLPRPPRYRPHPELGQDLATLDVAEPWPQRRPRLAGVSAMGFGGVNTHVVVAAGDTARRMSRREREIAHSAQDAELFLIAAATRDDLARQLGALEHLAARLSRAELADAAATLAQRCRADGHHAIRAHRAAVVAGHPAELATALGDLRRRCVARGPFVDSAGAGFLSDPEHRRRIGFVFPGQAVPVHPDGGALRRRFAWLEDLARPPTSDVAAAEDGSAEAGVAIGGPATWHAARAEVAQPAIVWTELATLRLLDRCHVRAEVAVGHSLGELVALVWAGVLDEGTALRLASRRGAAFAALPEGAMLAVECPADQAQALAGEMPVVVAVRNAPDRVVVSGPADAVRTMAGRCRAAGVRAVALPVRHAFHSPLLDGARPGVRAAIDAETVAGPARTMISTVTGRRLEPTDDVRTLLERQVVEPVRFAEALATAGPLADLFLEVGDGRTLHDHITRQLGVPVLSLGPSGPSLQGLLAAVGAAFAAGQQVDPSPLFDGRILRPLPLDQPLRFLANPCETAPVPPGDDPDHRENSGSPATTEPPEPPVTAGVGPEGAPLDDGAMTGRGPHHERPTRGGSEGVARVPGDPGDTRDIGDTVDTGSEAMAAVSELVAARTELPRSALGPATSLLDDLHLSSIAVADIAQEAAERLGLPVFDVPLEFADATIGDLASALDEHAATARPGAGPSPDAAGLRPWLRTYEVVWDEQPLPTPAGEPRPGHWEVVDAPGPPPPDDLVRSLATQVAPGGVLVWCPDDDPIGTAAALVDAAVRVANRREGHLVVVHHDAAVAGFARSLHLENPHLTTTVVGIPSDLRDDLDLHAPGAGIAAEVAREVRGAAGFTEVRYDAAGRRWMPVWRLLPSPGPQGPQALQMLQTAPDPWGRTATAGGTGIGLGAGDVVLATGGGRGIGAECALHLARTSGARVAVLGRSPADDPELVANLRRFAAAEVEAHYWQADVTDAHAVSRAVAAAGAALGPVTMVLHAAGVNDARSAARLDADAVAAAVRPKVDGLRHVLDAVDAAHLRHLVAFGSIIGRTGLPGEAHYALANERLRRDVERHAARHPACRCLVAEWSVWAGTGMGERMGRVNALARRGITPISVDAGTRMLAAELTRPATAPVARVLTGRFGRLPTVALAGGPLPLGRFLEHPQVHYPGVELVVDAVISTDSDPYLADHVHDGRPLLPAVAALEAMAQVARAVVGPETGAMGPPAFERVTFARPVAPAGDHPVRVRLCAVVDEAADGGTAVDVTLRSERTALAVDHVTARCTFRTRPPAADPVPAGDEPRSLPTVEPAADLYGLLFHGPTFRRVRGYRQLSARRCVAEVTTTDPTDRGRPTFGLYYPQDLVLGDIAGRDAYIHALQACVPAEVVVPTAVERLTLHGDLGPDGTAGHVVVTAQETAHDHESHTYDLDVTAPDGRLLESWRGLLLHVVRRRDQRGPWRPAHVGPVVERHLHEQGHAALRVAVVRDDGTAAGNGQGERAGRHTVALRQALGRSVRLRHRPDGRPELGPELAVSVAHGAGLTLVVAGPGADAPPPLAGTAAGTGNQGPVADHGPGDVACDLEPVAPRSRPEWERLLGPCAGTARVVATGTGEDFGVAATRLWTVVECARKLGRRPEPVTVLDTHRNGWVELGLGDRQVSTLVVRVHGVASPVVLAVATAPRGHAAEAGPEG